LQQKKLLFQVFYQQIILHPNQLLFLLDPLPKKLLDLALYEELEKGDISSFTPNLRSASLIPDHFGVFFPDFEL